MLYKFFKIITINLIILFFGLIFIELFFGSWFKENNFSNLLIHKKQTNLIDNFPYPSNNLGLFTKDNNGFRANKYKLDEIEILIIGGSTTEERDVDDNLIWTKIFEKNIFANKKTLNAGIGGQTSYGHKKMYDMWFSKLPQLKPKYIIIYLGINDALFLIENYDKKNNFNKGRILNNLNRDLLVNNKLLEKFVQYIKNNSAFHNLYLLIKGNIISRKLNINYNNNIKIFNQTYTFPPKENITIDRNDLNYFYKYYLKNIEDIIKINKNYNSKLFLVTQKIAEDHWLYSYLYTINSMTMEICNLKKIICFDLHNHILFDKKIDLYDGIHTTPLGSSKVGILIANFFNKNYQ